MVLVEVIVGFGKFVILVVGFWVVVGNVGGVGGNFIGD